MKRVAAAVVAVALVGSGDARAASAPAFAEPEAARLAAIECRGDLTGTPQAPVLLVHGTGATAAQNWSWGYERDLLARGHGVCTVQLPERGWVDVQRSAEYVATAIIEMARRSERKLSIVGHSQGGFQPLLALRLWPQLAADVDDFVGIAGVYDHGSQAIRADCSDGGCNPSFWQMASGSKFLAALSRVPLPAGPAYSTIGTLADDTVTPQPFANEMPGARSVEIQDVCPGRRFTMDHLFMAADAVMHALVIDALTHPGPVDPQRVDPAVCRQLLFPGADPLGVVTAVPTLFAAALDELIVGGEPPLRCPLSPACSVGPGALTATVVARRGRSITLRLSRGVRGAPARVRATASGRTIARGTLRARTLRLVLRPGARLPRRMTLRGQRLRLALRVG